MSFRDQFADVRAITAASKARHKRVPRPATASGFQPAYAISFVVVHLLAALAILPYFWSWWGLGAFIVGFYLFGFGIILGYHRLLSHNSFAVPKWLERFMVILAICSMQDTPALMLLIIPSGVAECTVTSLPVLFAIFTAAAISFCRKVGFASPDGPTR